MNRASVLLRFDQLSSSYLVISLLLLVVATAGILFYIGLIKWAVAIAAAVVQNGIRYGFSLWERLFAWASLRIFVSLTFACVFLGWLAAQIAPVVTVAAAVVPLFMGITASLAYMLIDQERYAVSRGHKAVHNPLMGQELAENLVRHGQAVGVPLLVAA